MRKAPSTDTQKTTLSTVFYALSDPARLRIVKMLLEKKEAPCGDCNLPVSKSTLSHHYKVLRQAGLVQTRGEGTWQFNSLKLDEIRSRFPGLLELIEGDRGPF